MSQITTHILDTSIGKPAAAVPVSLSSSTSGDWCELGSAVTDKDGRISSLVDPDIILPAGVYRLWFDTASYFRVQGLDTFYHYVEIVFNVSGDGQHYHVPLLLNPFGYSTYRGS